MEIVWIILSFLLMAIGLVGCFINRVPGPCRYPASELLYRHTGVRHYEPRNLRSGGSIV